MTPAINLLKKKKVPHKVHQYHHDSSNTDFGLEAIEALNQDGEQVFKTLLFCINGDPKALNVAVVPVAKKLDLKAAAKAAGAKKAEMANPDVAEKATGYIVGGISPLGQKRRLPTFVAASAQHFSTMFVSAGKRGVEVELSPSDLAKLTNARFSDIAR
ncbi:Cys-tRNA(Pro) deacylase [Thaumasiovibrio subtropicus]|uniref:Cys-tRNA(Pro) deacylase n=1 Tax=Thaumasiovibrio subtropicus TaxID=1891207 RepID=UPI000B35F358|nr:Cys-tRNA(Pro) deacylase [Thaumasiovibrio subtropicus]